MVNKRRREFLKILGTLVVASLLGKIIKDREEREVEKLVVRKGEIIIE